MKYIVKVTHRKSGNPRKQFGYLREDEKLTVKEADAHWWEEDDAIHHLADLCSQGYGCQMETIEGQEVMKALPTRKG